MSEQTNILSIVPKIEAAKSEAAKPQICGDVVELLELLLAEARKGEIIAIAAATVNTRNSIATCFTTDTQLVTLIGSVRLLSHRLEDVAMATDFAG